MPSEQTKPSIPPWDANPTTPEFAPTETPLIIIHAALSVKEYAAMKAALKAGGLYQQNVIRALIVAWLGALSPS